MGSRFCEEKMKVAMLSILCMSTLCFSRSVEPISERQKRYVRDDLTASDELTKLARSQSEIISQIIHSRTGDKKVFSGKPSQDACRDWWFVIAPACFFIEGLGHDPSSSYPCCRLDGRGAV